MLFTVTVYFLILVPPELNLVAVINILHPSPWSITLNIALIFRDTELRCAFLKLYRITSGNRRACYKFFCNIHRPVMIDADFSNDKNRMPVPYFSVPYGDFRHNITLDKTNRSLPFKIVCTESLLIKKQSGMPELDQPLGKIPECAVPAIGMSTIMNIWFHKNSCVCGTRCQSF